MIIADTNIHIRNGLGETICDDGTGSLPACNGAGNLIIGYNEVRGTGDDRNGSHNIVTGTENNFTTLGSGGTVFGKQNTLAEAYGTLLGGESNTVNGENSVVVGGRGNSVSAQWCVISAGQGNRASGNYTAISGGQNNLASGLWSTVSGGRDNTAYGYYSAVGGGYQRSTGTTSPANQYDWVAGSLFED